MIIGIDGYAGAGKDTCAEALMKLGFTRICFADALREACSHAFSIQYLDFIDRELKEKLYDKPLILGEDSLKSFCSFTGFGNKSAEVIKKVKGTQIESNRHLLRFMGTEVGRDMLDPQIWLNKYLEKLQDYSLIVTPDARFSNEKDLIKERKGKIAWIENPRVQVSSAHISENDKWPIDKHDIIVYNDSSIAKVQEEISLWWSLTRGR